MMEKTVKKAIVLLADGFEECEGLIVVDILRRAGIDTQMVSVKEDTAVESSRGITILADMPLCDADFDSADMLILPGGRTGTENLSGSETVREQCVRFAGDRYLAAICAAPSLLAEIGLLNGRKATCHPDFEGVMDGAFLTHDSVAADGNIITGQGLGASFDFAFTLAAILAGDDKVMQVKKAVCWKY